MKKTTKKKPVWTDVKRQLVDLDRPDLLGLIQDLYAFGSSNEAFLHPRFSLGADVLEPFKATIDRWVCPDLVHGQDFSIDKAEKAISDYEKAIGKPDGLAELTIHYCESCMRLLDGCHLEDDGYYEELVIMFERALEAVASLDPGQKGAFVKRLERIRIKGHECGWDVGDDMDDLMVEYGFAEE